MNDLHLQRIAELSARVVQLEMLRDRLIAKSIQQQTATSRRVSELQAEIGRLTEENNQAAQDRHEKRLRIEGAVGELRLAIDKERAMEAERVIAKERVTDTKRAADTERVIDKERGTNAGS